MAQRPASHVLITIEGVPFWEPNHVSPVVEPVAESLHHTGNSSSAARTHFLEALQNSVHSTTSSVYHKHVQSGHYKPHGISLISKTHFGLL